MPSVTSHTLPIVICWEYPSDRTIKNAANKSSDDLIIALIYWFSIKDNKFLNFSASYFKNTSKANLFSFLNFKTNISVFEDPSMDVYFLSEAQLFDEVHIYCLYLVLQNQTQIKMIQTPLQVFGIVDMIDDIEVGKLYLLREDILCRKVQIYTLIRNMCRM